MKYNLEKAIVAAIEPVLDDVIALEKRVAQLELRIASLERAADTRTGGTESPITLALERNRARA
jgi:hypothetical protein